MRLMLGRDEEITLSKVSLKTSMRVQSVKGCALFLYIKICMDYFFTLKRVPAFLKVKIYQLYYLLCVESIRLFVIRLKKR